MKTRYKYPASINTPEARKVYRRLKREIAYRKRDYNMAYGWYSEEYDSHNALKAKLKELIEP